MAALKANRFPFHLWLPVVSIMGVIFYFSGQQGKDIPLLFCNQDIFFHILIYGLLAGSFIRALKNSFTGFVRGKLVIFTVVFCLFYGITDELHQWFVPGRTVSGFDLAMDTLGGFIGSIVYTFFKGDS